MVNKICSFSFHWCVVQVPPVIHLHFKNTVNVCVSLPIPDTASVALATATSCASGLFPPPINNIAPNPANNASPQPLRPILFLAGRTTTTTTTTIVARPSSYFRCCAGFLFDPATTNTTTVVHTTALPRHAFLFQPMHLVVLFKTNAQQRPHDDGYCPWTLHRQWF